MRANKRYIRIPSIKATKSKPSALVYYIRLDFKGGDLTLYKIGYTTMTVVKRVEGYFDRKTRTRSVGMGLPKGCKYKIIAVVYRGSKEEAYRREQALHAKHRAERWSGARLCANGNTEMYIRDVLGLDKGLR